jgi:DNA-binding winged helix-turn-helix (wHTH) protein
MPIKLRFQAIQVLLMLAERSGQVVAREEIRRRLWSGDTFVDFERGINFCVNQIRAPLGDDAEKPHYVETLPRRGYRFIVPVTVELPREPALSVAPPDTKHEIHRGTSESNAGAATSLGMQVVPSLTPQIPAVQWDSETFLGAKCRSYRRQPVHWIRNPRMVVARQGP